MFNSWLPITRIKIFGAKILYKFVTLFVGKDKRVIERDGVKYEVDLAEGIELSLFLFGKFQSHITNNKFLKIKEDFVIIDIGANVGLMTLQFAKLVPKGKVISFEPTFYALQRLKDNLALNPELAKRVTVINSFVSEKSDSNPEIVAYSSWKVNGERNDNDHPVHLGTPKSSEGVPSISLNDFVEKENINRIDFIKIDTDGHEYEVFRGAEKAIAKLRPVIIFEIGLYVMDEKKISFDFYYNYFKKLNYSLVDTKTSVEITLDNYNRYIPKNGSTDLIALPS
ncbi:MAG: FkbM family methyltransferase [Bacteroidia bacterium]